MQYIQFRIVNIIWLTIILILFAVGCRNPQIVSISPDTYMLYREDHKGIFGSFASLKAGVIRDANVFAGKQGKAVLPISSREKPMGIGPAQWASFEYQFRVVDKNDPELHKASLPQQADIIVEKNEKITADIHSKNQSDNKDVYAELIKLDDLRKKEIISEEEFQTLKKKLLSEN
ncbi:MAG: hypothetical protein ACD_79C01466G0002 [uncultured bacterium]|nr:MAG: hypothetical protein ACD_79C01466G0002 [uncultured bacterium]